jgi:hypothetical protein
MTLLQFSRHIASLGGIIALKAQNKSRQTLVTLIEFKNPTKTTFIRQQNNAISQQVNNYANIGFRVFK